MCMHQHALTDNVCIASYQKLQDNILISCVPRDAAVNGSCAVEIIFVTRPASPLTREPDI